MLKAILAVVVLLLSFIGCIEELRQTLCMLLTKMSRRKLDGAVVLPAVTLAVCIFMCFLDYTVFVKAALAVYGICCVRELYYLWKLRNS